MISSNGSWTLPWQLTEAKDIRFNPSSAVVSARHTQESFRLQSDQSETKRLLENRDRALKEHEEEAETHQSFLQRFSCFYKIEADQFHLTVKKPCQLHRWQKLRLSCVLTPGEY